MEPGWRLRRCPSEACSNECAWPSSGPSRPAKITSRLNVLRTSSNAIFAVPVPGEALLGISLAPLKFTSKKIGAALLAGATTNVNAVRRVKAAVRIIIHLLEGTDAMRPHARTRNGDREESNVCTKSQKQGLGS